MESLTILSNHPRRRWRAVTFPAAIAALLAAVTAAALLGGCSDDKLPVRPSLPSRTYFMGFSSFPPGSLTPFSHLGLVDVNLAPKAALPEWDAIASRPRQ